MKDKSNIFWPTGIPPHEVIIIGRSLVFSISCQHALKAHAHALHVLDGAPAGFVEQVEAYYAVGVDVWVDGDLAVFPFNEHDFWCFYGIIAVESETKPEDLVLVQRIVVKYFDIHLPFLQILGRYEGYSRGKLLVDFCEFLS